MKKNRKLKSYSNQSEDNNSTVKRAKKDPKNLRRILNQKLRLSSAEDFDSDEISSLIYDYDELE